jgi:3-phosphoshikimate 1-carboxyvinyltransferase
MTTSKLISPIPHPLHASVRVPGSKSITNRAMLVSSLADGETTLTNALFSDDSRYFADALKQLGFAVISDPQNSSLTISGLGGLIPSHNARLFIGNAGTAARFLSAFLTLGEGEYILDGDARMRERPIADLVTALRQIGANIEPLEGKTSNAPGQISPPVKIIASGLPGGKTKIAGNISSQFLSALLMVAPYASSPVEIELTTELASRPYVDLTLAIMKDFGIELQRDSYERFRSTPAHYSSHPSFNIESDASSASYFFAAPAICSGTVRVENISSDSRQGDVAFLDVLAQMGCIVSRDATHIQVTGSSALHGIDVNMSDIPDTAQTLAAIAPFASSPTRIRGIASARLKETDRIHAACTELTRLGVKVEEYQDGMTIYPCNEFHPTSVQTYNDHRMAMAFALIGLRVAGISIENPACVTKTFPKFFDVFEGLGSTEYGNL